ANGPLPVPNLDTDATVAAGPSDPLYPLYLQQVANTVNALNSNLGVKARTGNDWVITPRLDYQPTSRDSLFLSLNANRFNSPGGVILDPTVGNYGTQTLANAYVRTFQATLGWTHTFSSKLLNEFHAATSQDNEIATPTGLAPNTSTIILDSPAPFILGNAPFSIGRVFERQYSLSDRIDYLIGKHTLQFGFDMSRTSDADQLIHVRRTWVHGHAGAPKTKASKAPVPMHSLLAESITRWHQATPYSQPNNWVFASFRLKGKKPRCANMLVEDYLRPAAVEAGVLAKDDPHRFGFHNL